MVLIESYGYSTQAGPHAVSLIVEIMHYFWVVNTGRC